MGYVRQTWPTPASTAVEAIVTFVLVFVVIAVATDERVANTVAPTAVGAALAVGVRRFFTFGQAARA